MIEERLPLSHFPRTERVIGFIGVRVLRDRDLKKGVKAKRHPIDGWFGVCAQRHHLRPLTPAAKAMLALVKP